MDLGTRNTGLKKLVSRRLAVKEGERFFATTKDKKIWIPRSGQWNDGGVVDSTVPETVSGSSTSRGMTNDLQGSAGPDNAAYYAHTVYAFTFNNDGFVLFVITP